MNYKSAPLSATGQLSGVLPGFISSYLSQRAKVIHHTSLCKKLWCECACWICTAWILLCYPQVLYYPLCWNNAQTYKYQINNNNTNNTAADERVSTIKIIKISNSMPLGRTQIRFSMLAIGRIGWRRKWPSGIKIEKEYTTNRPVMMYF